MKHILIVAALLVAFVFGQDAPSDVVVLTTANFKENMAKGDWLVEFYAPWCGHCKKLAPTLDQLATTLKGKVNIGKVDCTVETDLQDAFGVPGYPTLKFITKNEVYEYSGDRSFENLVAFVEGAYKSGTPKSLPTLEKKAPAPETQENSDVVILTDANFDELVSKGSWLLEFYAPWCGHCKKLAPIYEQVATELKGKVNVGKVDCTSERALGRRFGIMSYPTIKFATNGEIRDYKNARTLEALTEFATSGYTSAEATALPPRASAIEEFIGDVRDKLRTQESYLAQRVWIAIGASFVAGFIVGALAFGFRSSKPAPVKSEKRE